MEQTNHIYSVDNNHFPSYLQRIGWNALPSIVIAQALLVPIHIFTTDYIDPSLQFSLLSIGMRLGTSLFFVIAFFICRHFKTDFQIYLFLSFIANTLSDSYITAISNQEYLLTHLMGLCVVYIGFSLLIWRYLYFSLSLLISIISSALCFYLLSNVPFLILIEEGGSFLIFIWFMSLTVNYLRHRALRSQFKSNQKVRQKNEALKTSEEELRTNFEELKTMQEELQIQKNSLENTLQKLNITQNQLLQAEKMASLGQMTAGIAHEINNPLNFVSGGIQGIKHILPDLILLAEICEELEVPQSEDKKNALNKISQLKSEIDLGETIEDLKNLFEGMEVGVGRISEIVEGLSIFSNTENEQMINLSLHSCLDTILLSLKAQLKDISLEKQYDNAVQMVKCQPAQLTQALKNVINNALEATKHQGNITISTKKIEATDSILITISDNGLGIATDALNKVFEPFYTTKTIGEGIGLGLSIAHGVIEKHGGSISAESELGKGSLFRIILPAAIN